MKITNKIHQVTYKKIMLFVVLFIGITTTSIAQNSIKISGTLKDKKTKEPIAFAHVLINDTKHGTISDINGNFSINTNIEIKTLNIQLKLLLIELKLKKSQEVDYIIH